MGNKKKTKMKFLGVASALGLAASATVNQDWISYKSKFGKTYSAVEESRRFAIFKENAAYINRHNLDHSVGKETYTVGLNQFADLTNAEFRSSHLAEMVEAPQIRLNYQCPVAFVDNGAANPASVDWRSQANPQNTQAVTFVKDQGSCGSCWSFGGAAAFESAQCLAGNYDCAAWSGASEQQLWIAEEKTTPLWDHTTIWLATEVGSTTLCTTSRLKAVSPVTTLPHTPQEPPNKPAPVPLTTPTPSEPSRPVVPPPNSESELTSALAQVGAMGIAIDAGGIGFQLYSSG